MASLSSVVVWLLLAVSCASAGKHRKKHGLADDFKSSEIVFKDGRPMVVRWPNKQVTKSQAYSSPYANNNKFYLQDEDMLDDLLKVSDRDFMSTNIVVQKGKPVLLKSLINDTDLDDYDDYIVDEFDVENERELAEFEKNAEPPPKLCQLISQDSLLDQASDNCDMDVGIKRQSNFWRRISRNVMHNMNGVKFYVDLARRYRDYTRAFNALQEANKLLLGEEPVSQRMLRLYMQLDEELFAKLIDFKKDTIVKQNIASKNGLTNKKSIVVNEQQLEDMTHLFRVLDALIVKLEEELEYFKGLANVTQVKNIDHMEDLDADAQLEMLKKEAIERKAVVLNLSDEERQRMKLSQERVKRIMTKGISNFAEAHLKIFIRMVILSTIGAYLSLIPSNLVVQMLTQRIVVSKEAVYLPTFLANVIKGKFVGTMRNFLFTQSFNPPPEIQELDKQLDSILNQEDVAMFDMSKALYDSYKAIKVTN